MTRLTVDNVSLIYPTKRTTKSKYQDLGLVRERGLGSLMMSSGESGILALREIMLDLRAGHRLGIVGRNGSGKSTLLRVMAGLYPPTLGSVRVNGNVSALFNVGIGMKQEATGVENIILGGLIRGLTRREAEKKVSEIAEFSGLGDYLNLPVRTYSRGMSMRLAFSTATAFDPEILLMDEWIGAGDKVFRKKAMERMKSLVNGAGIVVLASHRIPLLKSVSTHFLWLENGRMVAFGEDPAIADAFQAEAIAENRDDPDNDKVVQLPQRKQRVGNA